MLTEDEIFESVIDVNKENRQTAVILISTNSSGFFFNASQTYTFFIIIFNNILKPWFSEYNLNVNKKNNNKFTKKKKKFLVTSDFYCLHLFFWLKSGSMY